MGLPSHNVYLTKQNSAGVYIRHRPEATLLYQIVQEYWPEFQAELAKNGKYLPAYVIKEFDEYLKCGRLEHGFLRVRCESCHDEKLVAFSCKKRGFCPSCGARRMADSAALLVDEILPHQPMRQWVLSVPFPLRFLFASNPKAMTGVLGIVYRAISTHLTHKAGLTKPTAQTGAVTLIQHFGSALNLNIHFHMIFLDGVYTGGHNGIPICFRPVKVPNRAELTRLTHTIAQRVGRYLERQGLMERDAGNIFLTQEAVGASDEDPTNQLLGSSVTYRIAVGPQQGRKVFTLQTLPDAGSDNLSTTVVGEVSGFSLHAGVATRANEREKLERLCRYITRPPISTIDASWDWSSYSTLHPCALMDNGESPPLYDFIGEGSINYLAAVTIMADQSGDIIAGNITGGSVCELSVTGPLASVNEWLIGFEFDGTESTGNFADRAGSGYIVFRIDSAAGGFTGPFQISLNLSN